MSILSRYSANLFVHLLPIKNFIKCEKIPLRNQDQRHNSLISCVGFNRRCGWQPIDSGQKEIGIYLRRRGFSKRSSKNEEQKAFSYNTGIKNMFQNLFRNLFGRYLLLTNTIGSGILMVFGDTLAQCVEMYKLRVKMDQLDEDRKSKEYQNSKIMDYDILRVCRMFVVGAIQGPLHHVIYVWMERIMPVANLRNTLCKILIDQTVLSPLCIILFFSSACALENKNFTEAYAELKQKFLYIYSVDWCVWPIVQYMNFRYLDPKYRVTYVNICTAFYNIFMSYMKHNE